MKRTQEDGVSQKEHHAPRSRPWGSLSNAASPGDAGNGVLWVCLPQCAPTQSVWVKNVTQAAAVSL